MSNSLQTSTTLFRCVAYKDPSTTLFRCVACKDPVSGRLVDIPGALVMEGKQLWSDGVNIITTILERRSDSRMRLLPRSAQQRTVCCVLYQSMLKHINRLRWHATQKQEVGARQLVQGLPQRCLRVIDEFFDQLIAKLPTNCCTLPGNVVRRRAKTIKTG